MSIVKSFTSAFFALLGMKVLLMSIIYKDWSEIMGFIPTIIERSANIERVYDLFSCLLKERIILCIGEINDDLAASITAQLLYLSSLSNEDILMYINSPGGSVSSGLAIYDTMNYVKCDVSTIGMGCCASMASILLAAGAKDKRLILENCEVMIHQPMGASKGQASDMEIATRHILEVQQRLYTILTQLTSQPIETIKKDCDRDCYLNAKQAIAYGLVDKIV